MSIIVVEGCDGSGKSTLLENARIDIKRKYFVIVKHSCRPLSALHITGFLDLIERNRPFPIVCDRHPLISEPIYGPLLRRDDLTDLIAVNADAKDDRVARSVDRIIYCRPPRQTIIQNLDKNPQLAGVRTHIDALVDSYDSWMNRLGDLVEIVPYDYTSYTGTLDDLFFGSTV